MFKDGDVVRFCEEPSKWYHPKKGSIGVVVSGGSHRDALVEWQSESYDREGTDIPVRYYIENEYLEMVESVRRCDCGANVKECFLFNKEENEFLEVGNTFLFCPFCGGIL